MGAHLAQASLREPAVEARCQKVSPKPRPQVKERLPAVSPRRLCAVETTLVLRELRHHRASIVGSVNTRNSKYTPHSESVPRPKFSRRADRGIEIGSNPMKTFALAFMLALTTIGGATWREGALHIGSPTPPVPRPRRRLSRGL